MDELTGKSRDMRSVSSDEDGNEVLTGGRVGASKKARKKKTFDVVRPKDLGLALIAHEFGKAMYRADTVQRHARYLEHLLDTKPESTIDANALIAANLELRAELSRLRVEHHHLVQSTTWRVGRRLQHLGHRYPRMTSAARRFAKLAYWTATLRLVSRLRERQGVRDSMVLLAQSPLFDREWYLRRYAHLLPSDVDPVSHYFWSGAVQGLDPHPLFNSTWYLAALSGAPGINPLVHYIKNRGRGTPDPHPLFDTAFYLRQRGDKAEPGMTPLEDFLAAAPGNTYLPNLIFDPAAYAEEYFGGLPDRPDALVHYAAEGEAAGFWPHPFFDPKWYANAHPDSAALGPLGHYLRSGHQAAGVPCSEHMARLDRQVTLPLELAFAEHDAPRISIIIPIYGHVFETWRCLATIMLMTEKVTYEVIVADDRPTRPVAQMLRAAGITVIINNENQGFLANCNSAAKRARGEDILFLNNDTTVRHNWLAPMVAVMNDDARVGVVGCKLLNPDGSVQEAGGIIYSTGWGDPFGQGDAATRGCYNYTRDVDVVTGACFVVRRKLFETLGGFDSRYAPAFYEEFDLATSIRNAGYRIVYQPASEVYHHGSASYGIETRDRQTLKNHGVFCRKWATLLSHQPAPDTPPFLSRERPSPRGMILVVDDKVPEYDKHAGAVTLFQYLGLLRELGLRVVYAPHDGEAIEPYTRALQQRGIEVLHRPDTLHSWIRKNGCFVDFIWTARPDVTAPILPWLKRHTGAKILYYTHDLHYLREQRRYELEGSVWALQESERLKPIELAIFREVDCVMTPSPDEAREILQEVPDANVAVIPPYLYGDTTIVASPDDLAARQDILFIGGFDHTPNVDAALWLVQDIMPLVWQERPETTVWIVGNVPPDSVKALESKRVRVTGFVPDLDPYMQRARVSLSPLRYGAGVKGKIVTSLQAGVPVVTTPCGNEGIQLRDGRDALIGETAAELADAALRLLRDPELCDRLVRSGADVVRTRFSKELARRTMRELLGNTLCPVCGARPRQKRRRASSNWREEIHCLACDTLNRSAGLAQVIMVPWVQHGVNVLGEARVYLTDQRVHEFGHTGSVGKVLADISRFSCSDYFDDLRKGEISSDGILHEDIQDISFDDNSVDLFLSQDVMEHVADPWQGFAEVYRCLKPNGRYVFTVPIDLDRPDSLTRAVLEDGLLRHIEPAEYHGDPRRAGGALVFTEFGADLVDRLAGIGFRTQAHRIEMPEGEGQPLYVFEARKPNSAPDAA
ncbi:glycosyltransferase [Lichenicola sp.]|uniref:glycosyltransferase n=1 Tax=Lichenicola sp. TaxID=2804529 RepID=UPI003B00BF3D